eukprot:25443_1
MDAHNVAGFMSDGWEMGKVQQAHAKAKVHKYPKAKNVTGNKKCQRRGCKTKSDAKSMYWCAHCAEWYCSIHNSDHNLNTTECYGINNEWVIQGEYLYKGKCEESQYNTSAKVTIKCGKYIEYYCNHCERWFCEQHSKKHNAGMTKCFGIKRDEVIPVTKKGDKGRYANSGCCVIL